MTSPKKICLLLHFYQPFNQQNDILLRIVNECYLPLTRGLLKIPQAKLVVNINGSLTKLLLDNGYREVLDNLKLLLEGGKIEMTDSAMYHSFLPLLPESEIERQIVLNHDINAEVFGPKYSPVGFFSPEMAVNDVVMRVVSRLGYKWTACSESALPAEVLGSDTAINAVYKDASTGIKLLFRNKRISAILLSAASRSSQDFIHEVQDLVSTDGYLLGVMDAETFGHHRIGHEKMLFEVLSDPLFEPVLTSDIFNSFSQTQSVNVRPSTWSNVEQDFWLDKEKTVSTESKSFILWKDPSNPIHELQWQLTYLTIESVNAYENKTNKDYLYARDLLDKSLSSDQYWWASTKPWWSLEMVEQGAFALKTVLVTLMPNSQNMQKAEDLYRKILDLAFDWQRRGIIRQRHLDNSGTYLTQPLKKRTPPEWLNQLVLEFENEMNKATGAQQFEKAIKWRDALIKIKLETDIYDVLHVVDELWTARNLPSLKPFLQYEWDEFSDFAKEYLIDQERNPLTGEAFEKWKPQAKS